MKTRTTCALTPAQATWRGIVWIGGSFVLCPCHLPITLWAVGALLSGTALGALVRGHVILAGVLISFTWLVSTLHGFNLMRRGRVDAYTNSSRSRVFKELEESSSHHSL
jgi:hypothetical protein